MVYNDKVLNEFFNPQNVGVIKGASGKGKIVSAIDGEIMKIYIQVEGELITNAQFQTFGCVAAIACSSVATRLMINKTIEQAKLISAEDIIKELGELPESKMHCVAMAEETIKDAIESYYNRLPDDEDDDNDDNDD